MTDQETISDKLKLSIDLINKYKRSDGSIGKPVSLIQRHLVLGYAEAKAIVDEIRRLGIIS